MTTTAQGSSIWGLLLPIILMAVLFYFLIWRPQQRQQSARKTLLAGVRKGDEIVTVGGLYGKVVELSEETLLLEVSEGCRVKLARGGISRVLERENEHHE